MQTVSQVFHLREHEGGDFPAAAASRSDPGAAGQVFQAARALGGVTADVFFGDTVAEADVHG